MSTKPTYIPSISGLRAISILLVLNAHWGYFDPQGYLGIFANASLGVNIFFVISGYLITSLLLNEEEANSTISLKNFYIRRTIRIFPALYILLLFYFILQLLGIIYIEPMSWVTSITYTKYFPIENGTDVMTNHLWSLSNEEHFYLLWPFVFKYLKKQRKLIAFILVAIIPIFRILGYKYGYAWFHVDSLFCRGDAIIWGCIIAIYQKEILAFLKDHKWARYAPFIVFILLLCIEKTTILYSNVSIIKRLHLGYFSLPFGGSLGTLTSVSIGLIILISSNFKSLWSGFLNLKFMDYIGKISYSLYLYQQIFALYFKHKMNIGLAFLLSIVAALASYYLIEKPFLKLKKRFNV